MEKNSTGALIRFYNQCIEKNCADMSDEKQRLRARVYAEELRLKYRDIGDLFIQAEQAEAELHKDEETKMKERESAILARDAMQKKRKTILLVLVPALLVLATILLLTLRILPNRDYDNAIRLYAAGEYEEAISAFEALGSFKDSVNWLQRSVEAKQELDFQTALELFEHGKIDESAALFAALGDYQNSQEWLERAILPSSSPSDSDTESGPPAFIILSWNEEGEYGQPWTAENDEGVEESYIAFHLPVGIYRVLNNNAASAKVTVCDDVPEEKSEDIQDLLLEESTRTVTVLASKSKELTLDEGQHLRLSENAENVIFQYLGEIPEVVEDEKDESEDSNATAITAWVNGKEVHMRKSASVSAFIMASFDTGKEVLVTGETGDWTAVTVDNQEGYIYSRYITYEKPDSAK